MPASDGRRIVIGWISNWMYARQKPTSPWRGAQSVPRELKLKRFKEGLRLTQQPVKEIESLRGETTLTLNSVSVDDANRKVAEAGFSGDVWDIQAEIEVGAAEDVGFKVLKGNGQETLVGFTADPAEVYIDRTKSGKVDFHETFAGRHSARLDPVDGRVTLRILVDRSVVEVFGGDGRVAITDRVFPDLTSTGLSLYSVGGNAKIVELKAWKLRSAWK